MQKQQAATPNEIWAQLAFTWKEIIHLSVIITYRYCSKKRWILGCLTNLHVYSISIAATSRIYLHLRACTVSVLSMRVEHAGGSLCHCRHPRFNRTSSLGRSMLQWNLTSNRNQRWDLDPALAKLWCLDCLAFTRNNYWRWNPTRSDTLCLWRGIPQGFDSSGECEEASMPRVDAAIRVMIPTARDCRFEGGEKLDQVIRIVSKHSRPR